MSQRREEYLSADGPRVTVTGWEKQKMPGVFLSWECSCVLRERMWANGKDRNYACRCAVGKLGVLLGAVSFMVGQQAIAFGWQWHSVTIGLALDFFCDWASWRSEHAHSMVETYPAWWGRFGRWKCEEVTRGMGTFPGSHVDTADWQQQTGKDSRLTPLSWPSGYRAFLSSLTSHHRSQVTQVGEKLASGSHFPAGLGIPSSSKGVSIHSVQRQFPDWGYPWPLAHSHTLRAKSLTW